MLRSIRRSYGDKLAASDGDIGQVNDFYFDDQNWAVRYLVADTGTWLSGRQVLITPHALGAFDPVTRTVAVRLTRRQIEASPAIELHQPVSRQYEAEYYRYYGWPFYWQGDALWGMSGFPVLEQPARPFPRESTTAHPHPPERPDRHLRSTQAVTGYHLQASDGTIGHVCDWILDDQSWAIRQLVIRTGHRLSGREVEIPTRQVSRISYEESTVFVKVTAKAIEESPSHPVRPENVVA